MFDLWSKYLAEPFLPIYFLLGMIVGLLVSLWVDVRRGRSLLLIGLLAALSGWGCSKTAEPPQPRGATVAVRVLSNSQQVEIVLRRGGDLPIELRAVIVNESMSIEPGDQITVRVVSRKP